MWADENGFMFREIHWGAGLKFHLDQLMTGTKKKERKLGLCTTERNNYV